MITAEQLLTLINEFTILNEKTVFSPELSADTTSLMQKESFITLLFFKEVYSLLLLNESTDIEKAEALIRGYLNSRWHLLNISNISYFRHPFLPANQLCLKIAEAVRRPDEAICELLIPRVSRLVREAQPLKYETEEDGHFPIENFCLSRSGRLIPVVEIFEQAKVNTNCLFPEFQTHSTPVYYLHPQDFLTLQNIAGEASSNYMQALRAHHVQRYDNKTIGFAIKNLAIALQRGSEKGAGNEMQAESALVAKAIKDFYDLWFGLPAKIRDEAGTLQLNEYGGKGVNLEGYLLVLFEGHYACPLTAQQQEKIKIDKILNCINQISHILQEFLIQHPHLYTIDVSHNKTIALPNLEVLAAEAINALKTRTQTTDGNDERLLVSIYDSLNLLVEESQELFVEPLSFPNDVMLGSVDAINRLEKILKPKAQSRFAESYVAYLVSQITNENDLLKIIKDEKHRHRISMLLKKIQNQLNTLLTSEAVTLEIILLINPLDKFFAIGPLEKKLREWIQKDPKKYWDFAKVLCEPYRVFFQIILAPYMSELIRKSYSSSGFFGLPRNSQLYRLVSSELGLSAPGSNAYTDCIQAVQEYQEYLKQQILEKPAFPSKN